MFAYDIPRDARIRVSSSVATSIPGNISASCSTLRRGAEISGWPGGGALTAGPSRVSANVRVRGSNPECSECWESSECADAAGPHRPGSTSLFTSHSLPRESSPSSTMPAPLVAGNL
jgi:hypothetical protein